jgi:Ca-activated chloride channel family protein
VREVLAVITPPARPREGSSRPKQMLFVLDTSGSMGRERKLDQARDAMYASLEKLTAQDAFNIVEFDGAFTTMAEEPVVATEESLAQAREWLRSLRPGGNTMLLPALSAAIEQPEDTQRHEMIVLISDGAVQDPAQVERMLREELGQGRLFLVGIGDDVNRENIMRFAEVGRGTAVFATDPKALDVSLARLFDQISEPLFWDIQLNVGQATIESMEPSRIPDLYGGRSVTVRLRVRGELPEALEVSGETMEGPRTFTAPLRRD